MSFIRADELADVILHFTNQVIHCVEYPIYHVNDGNPISYKQLIYTLCETFDYKKPKFSIPYWLLYAPVRLYEIIFRVDPETTKSSLSSIRLKLVGQDNYFSNGKLQNLFPDLKFTSFLETAPQLKSYYSSFV